MSVTQTLTELTQSIQVKDVISITLNTEVHYILKQFLNQNFSLIKQCLQKIQQLDSKLQEQQNKGREVYERLNYIQKDISSNKEAINGHQSRIKELQGNIGDDFMKKIYDLEQKTKNSFGLDETVNKIQAMNKFITSEFFKTYDNKVSKQIQGVDKIKDQFDRYVQNTTFDHYKDQTQHQIAANNMKIDQVKGITNGIENKVQKIDNKVTQAKKDVEQNNSLMKQINFTEMQDKIKKFKDDVESKVGEMGLRLKKKAGTTELTQLQKRIIEKLDLFLISNTKGKADKDETKDALQFLEKRINDLYQLLSQKESDEENDALFSSKRWNCASCARDLGKYEGKLGMFKPWSVFPCKELDPQKTGGYGYLNYVDKLSYKKGLTTDDQGLQRLNKTFFERNKDSNSPKKMNSTRTTNFMSNFGSQERQNPATLKQQYFQNQKITEKSGAKLFRVKRQAVRVNGNTDPMPSEKKKNNPQNQ